MKGKTFKDCELLSEQLSSFLDGIDFDSSAEKQKMLVQPEFLPGIEIPQT